jgi:glycosyltransferase involved in cell wall biosynthesis
MDDTPHIPTIAVIVPTHNSARYLRVCLEAILAQHQPAHEVIVCDNASTDATVSIAHELGVRVMSAGPERSAQRNAAARAASGEALLFIDSDMRLRPDVLGACVAQWRQGARIVTIPEVVVGDTLWARARELEKRLGEGTPGYEAARFVERTLFLHVGGYDERMVAGEDYDLHQSLVEAGATLGAAEAAIDHLEYGLRLRDYVRKWRYYATCLDPFIQKRGARAAVPFLPLLALRRWQISAHDPLGLVGFVALKSIEFAVIGWRSRFGRGVNTHIARSGEAHG